MANDSYDYIRQVELPDGSIIRVHPETTIFRSDDQGFGRVFFGIKTSALNGELRVRVTYVSGLLDEHLFTFKHGVGLVTNGIPTLRGADNLLRAANCALADLNDPELEGYHIIFFTTPQDTPIRWELTTTMPETEFICLNDTYSLEELNNKFTVNSRHDSIYTLANSSYGTGLPTAGNPGRIFFVKVPE